jgi:hypothetical protein
MARGRVETTSAILVNAPFSTVINPPTDSKKVERLLDKTVPYNGSLTVEDGGGGVNSGDTLLYVSKFRPTTWQENSKARYKFKVKSVGGFYIAYDLTPDFNP